jgi:predicted transcriptional regulator
MPAQPLAIAFPPDQVEWLTHQARKQRTSRSALVRQAVDALMAQQPRKTAADQDN